MSRLLQFYRAVTEKLTEEDRNFIAGYLCEKEQKLFYAMHRADQCHVLHVVKTALAISDEERIDCPLLVRICLLHDVGRVRGDLDIFGKVFAVLADKLFPKQSRSLAEKEQRGRIAQMLYVYYQHPRIGAEKLRGIGAFREAELIEDHHKREAPSDMPELRILKQADALN